METEITRFPSARYGANLHVTGIERCSGARNEDEVDDDKLQWAAIERLPTLERLRMSLFDGPGEHGKTMVDVTKLGPAERQLIVDKLISNVEEDNRRLLLKIRERMDKVNVKLPTVEVRFNNLSVEAECEVVHGKPIPTMWNTLKSTFSAFARMACLKSENTKLGIVKGVSGIIKPSRMTLLLGPPGCGKTTFLKALVGKLDQSLKVRGKIYYNECQLENLMPQKISAYISQYDLHTPEMTVRETLDFSARCQGVGSKTDVMLEVSKKEKQVGIIPEPLIDAFMKATSISGLERSVKTDYIIKILGMEICANTIVGDNMRRGISGGQKRRLATAEIIVGPKRVLFMDEISNGLDSSTTFRIVACLQQFVHITEATAIISLLQPAPEIFDLFDDIILLAEGKIVYQGPKHDVLQFFEDCGFKCPERKGVADFLQEVISSKDQEQYWYNAQLPYEYISVDGFSDRFQRCHLGKQLNKELSKQNDSILSEQNVLYNSNSSKYSISKWELLKACMDREVLLMKRNSSIYAIKLVQLAVLAVLTMTVFIRTRMAVDFKHTEYFLGSLFYGIMRMMINGIAELTMTVSRLAVFYKQRDFNFYPAWAYAISTSLLKVPLSLVESFIWTALTYYVIGYTPEVERFLRQFLMFFALHLALMSLFRFIASICRREVTAIFVGNVILNVMFLSGGFIIPQSSMPAWIRWVFWTSLASYAEIGVAVNEFLAPRWKKVMSNNLTIGDETLTRHGLDFKDFFYWISLGVIFGLAILFNIGFILALTFLNSAGKSRAIISHERFHHQRNGDEPNAEAQNGVQPSRPPLVMESILENTIFQNSKPSRMVLPFEPLTLTFQHIQYSIDTPVEMTKQGFTEKRLQLLHDVTGALRPGILTALMGISGAGKTTLLDVLAGRKSSGYIEGDIKVGGYPKVQETFARITGYCEQADIHSPQITVEESLIFSAWLRLPSEIDKITKAEFVKDVLERIELDEVKDSLVGLPGITGLSNEQRKRLTIAVELVSNPSIIFMDEPTTGLDARAAAIVMRAVKNVANTGRTVVCTIHQPSINIFEAFDEMILMKKGGQVIFSGPLGEHSSKLLDYFQRIPGLPKIKENHNPATWMLEVTSTTVEATLGLDLAQVYHESPLFGDNLELVQQLSEPLADTGELRFPTRYPCNSWEQFKACTWKQNLSYWRNPEYNYTRMIFMIYQSVLLAALMWHKGQKISNEQDFFNIIGSIFASMQSVCTCISASTIPVVATERVVLYREKFAGMYSSWAYAIAQVTIELPYILVLGVLFALITYPTVGFFWSGYKVFWYFYASFCILLGYTNIGMLIVALSPNGNVASISALAFYTLLNLFAGYFMPGPAIPKWWTWCYWISPTSWFLKAIITALYGDIGEQITAFGEKKALNSFIQDYFGYHPHHLAISIIVLTMFPILYAFLFAFFTAKLNFQK